MTTVSSLVRLNETVPIDINIGATFHNLSFDVPVLVDGMSLTSTEFDRSHPVVLYQLIIY
jgi:hypothetical protein